MPANATLTSANPADAQSVIFRPYFQEAGDGSTTGNYAGYLQSYAKRVVLQGGIQPSYALVDIPLSATDDTAPAKTALNGGPLDKIRAGTPAVVKAIVGSNAMDILAGYVVEAHQDLDHDSISVEIADARYLLQAVPIVGAWWMSGTSYQYRQGWRAHVNPNGQPNCIHRDTGTERVPMFCHPNHGLAVDKAPEDPNADSTTKCCDWTAAKLLQYIRWHASNAAYTAISSSFPWYAYAHSQIDWPKEWAGILSTSVDEAFYRKAPEMVLKADNVLELIETILNGIGGFSIYIGPKVDENTDKTKTYKATLQVIRTWYRGGGVTVNRAAGGAASSTLASSRICTGGTLGESAKHLYTKFVSAGQLVFVERRRDTSASAGLIPAWSSADEVLWESSIDTDLDASVALATAIENANRKYPNVFAAWKLDETIDFQTGTSEAGMPLAQVGRPILGEILTSYIEDSAAGQTTKRRFRMPVYVEAAKSDGTTYFLCQQADGLTLDPDGTIWLNNLRQLELPNGISAGSGEFVPKQTYYFTATPTSSVAAAGTKRNLRMTVAIPCDHRFLKATRLPSDPTTSIKIPLTTASDDNDRIDKNLSRLYYADTGELSGLELRTASWPTPQSVNDATVASEKTGGASSSANSTTNTLRWDGVELQAHANARRTEKGRLAKPCSLLFPYASPAWQPGQSLKALNNIGLTGGSASYFLGRVVQRVIFETDKKSQRMKVEAE